MQQTFSLTFSYFYHIRLFFWFGFLLLFIEKKLPVTQVQYFIYFFKRIARVYIHQQIHNNLAGAYHNLWY